MFSDTTRRMSRMPTAYSPRPTRTIAVVPKRRIRSPATCAPDDDEQTRRQQPQTVAGGGQVLGVLEEDRQHEAQPELAHGHHRDGEQPVTVGLEVEVGELEQRVAARGARILSSSHTKVPRMTTRQAEHRDRPRPHSLPATPSGRRR